MKYFFFIIISISSFSSLAQSTKNQVTLSKYEEKAKTETGRISMLFHCKKEQQDSILVVITDYYYQMAKLQNVKLNLPDRNRLLTNIENSLQSGLEKILTVEQYQTYLAGLSHRKLRWQIMQDSLIKVHQNLNSGK